MSGSSGPDMTEKARKKLLLPGVTVTAPAAGPITLLALGGRQPTAKWFQAASCSAVARCAVDKGVSVCREAGLIPHRLTGDCDSARAEDWQWAESCGAVVDRYQSDKDFTDFQLALALCSEKAGEAGEGDGALLLTGCFGGRFDHLWSTVISFLKLSGRNQPLGMADDSEGLFFLTGPGELTAKFSRQPEAISLISFSEETTGLCLSGVHWPLENTTLKYAVPYSISNRAESSLITLSCLSGTVGLYWVFKEEKCS